MNVMLDNIGTWFLIGAGSIGGVYCWLRSIFHWFRAQDNYWETDQRWRRHHLLRFAQYFGGLIVFGTAFIGGMILANGMSVQN